MMILFYLILYSLITELKLNMVSIMSKVFFISAGQLDVKKDPSVKNKKNMYLNYGALLLSTIIKNAGFNIILMHGHFKKPLDFFSDLSNEGILKSDYPIFISIPSFFALTWVKELVFILKNKKKLKNKIYVGGRWVIDNKPSLLKKELTGIDGIIEGLGENKILPLLSGIEDRNNYQNVELDYSILYERRLFQPSIEVSRGCRMKCEFCQEKNEELTKLKSPEKIISEYKKIVLDDNLNTMNPYFECSIFISEKKWIERFINLRANNNISFLWRTESRVDKLNINHIPLLAKAGLKVIDLGLESASEVQLKKMGKTKNPANYLKKASELLKACYENRIKTKVNIMLYAGETYETLDKTLQWLRAHKDYIYGVSAGVVFAFGWDENKKEYLDEMISLGASIYQKNNLIGVTKFNLSDEIDYDESMKLIKDISNEFMSDDHYFYLKSFSYYPRDYTKTQFDIDINNERIKQS